MYIAKKIEKVVSVFSPVTDDSVINPDDIFEISEIVTTKDVDGNELQVPQLKSTISVAYLENRISMLNNEATDLQAQLDAINATVVVINNETNN